MLQQNTGAPYPWRWTLESELALNPEISSSDPRLPKWPSAILTGCIITNCELWILPLQMKKLVFSTDWLLHMLRLHIYVLVHETQFNYIKLGLTEKEINPKSTWNQILIVFIKLVKIFYLKYYKEDKLNWVTAWKYLYHWIMAWKNYTWK